MVCRDLHGVSPGGVATMKEVLQSRVSLYMCQLVSLGIKGPQSQGRLLALTRHTYLQGEILKVEEAAVQVLAKC